MIRSVRYRAQAQPQNGKGLSGPSRSCFSHADALRTAKPLLEKIDRVHKDRGLFRRGDSIVVGLSGGPDSTALLHLLKLLSSRWQLRLVAAHLDHRIDKRRSASHAALARAIAGALDVPFVRRSVSVPAYSKKHRLSLEEAGRLLRYRFFEQVAAKTDCRKIATAHTLDDQAETVLLRLIRGAGLRGLSAIAPVRAQGRFTLIRPLLRCRKTELLAFLKANRVRFAVDRSNKDMDFTRNRVRAELLPRLRRLNPCVEESLSSLRDAAADAEAFLDQSAQELASRRLSGGSASTRLDLAAFDGLHRAMRRQLLRLAVRRCQGHDRRLGSAHIEALERLALEGKKGALANLPGGITARISGSSLLLTRSD